MLKLPRRTLADWTPGDGDVDAWLASWAEDGWVPEHPWGGTQTFVHGRPVTRWAMIINPGCMPTG